MINRLTIDRASHRAPPRAPGRAAITMLAAMLALVVLSSMALVSATSLLAAGPPPPPPANPKRLETPDWVEKAKAARRRPGSAVRYHPFMTDAEQSFRTAVSEMLADLKATDVSADDKARLGRIAKAAKRGKLVTLIDERAAISDPIALALADWLKLRAGYGTPQDYIDFLKQHAYWPADRAFKLRMETMAFTNGGTVGELKTLFSLLAPESGVGYAALASAHLAAGERAQAARLAARAWSDEGLPDSLEAGFMERFQTVLKPVDHMARIDRLLSRAPRSRRARNARANAVRRMLPYLPEALQKVATARLSIYLGQPSANKLVAALPEADRTTPGVLRQQAQRAARAGKPKQAAKLLASVPAGKDSPAPDADWDLRRTVAAALIEAGANADAYAVVADAWPDDENARKDQAFLAGTIALEKLNDPPRAIKHFTAMVAAADGPLSRSKSNYWLARALFAANRDTAGQEALAAAGAQRDTFHGALARMAMDPPQRALTLPLPPMPSAEDVKRFSERSVIRAAIIADRIGLDRSLVRLLFGNFTWRIDNGAEILLAAQLADDLGDTQIAVRAGKAGVAKGHDHYLHSYPVHRLPQFDPLGKPPRPELLLSIARQESEFNTQIVSRAGARGVLQVMPITARHVCRAHSLSCQISRLLRDPSYNARIAAAYIAEQMETVDRNMILTLTSYNAGPGRTRQWLRQRGDPRAPQANPLAWVYDIPFTETRLYVQKVLSNLQVYRARLGRPNPVQIDRDLGFRSAAQLR